MNITSTDHIITCVGVAVLLLLLVSTDDPVPIPIDTDLPPVKLSRIDTPPTEFASAAEIGVLESEVNTDAADVVPASHMSAAKPESLLSNVFEPPITEIADEEPTQNEPLDTDAAAVTRFGTQTDPFEQRDNVQVGLETRPEGFRTPSFVIDDLTFDALESLRGRGLAEVIVTPVAGQGVTFVVHGSLRGKVDIRPATDGVLDRFSERTVRISAPVAQRWIDQLSGSYRVSAETFIVCVAFDDRLDSAILSAQQAWAADNRVAFERLRRTRGRLNVDNATFEVTGVELWAAPISSAG